MTENEARKILNDEMYDESSPFYIDELEKETEKYFDFSGHYTENGEKIENTFRVFKDNGACYPAPV